MCSESRDHIDYNYRRREEATDTDMSRDTNIPTSPDRHTFQQERYCQRREEDNEPVDDELLSVWAEIRDSHRRRFDDPDRRENNMEWDLVNADWLIAKVRASDSYAQNLYAAMCNREFIRNEVWQQLRGEPRWHCSWRYAGGIIADLREQGDYVDWYCSGIRQEDGSEQDHSVSEGTVTDEIREDLLKLGWVVLDDEG
jgi:hypothetical protein